MRSNRKPWRRFALQLEIGQVSCERIRDELTLMLTEGHARQAFELLDATGLLAQVLPEAVKMHGVEQPPQFHPEGDVWVHTMLLLEKLRAGLIIDARVGRAAARYRQTRDVSPARSQETWRSHSL